MPFLAKIKVFLKDLFVTFFYFLFTNKHSNRVFMFHSINDSQTNPKKFVSNNKEFESFIKNLTLHYLPKSLIDLLKNKSKNSFSITFDDGHEGVYYYAFPILKDLNIPFTIFITIDFIGTPGYLTWEQLFQMLQTGLCTIGSHTFSHPMLRFCNNQLEEILESKKKIEQIINKEVVLFAYPFGSVFACSHKNVKCAKLSGYEYAFSSIGLPINIISKKNKYFIPRINGDPEVLAFAKHNKHYK